jgi:hypothetical protein
VPENLKQEIGGIPFTLFLPVQLPFLQEGGDEGNATRKNGFRTYLLGILEATPWT